MKSEDSLFHSHCSKGIFEWSHLFFELEFKVSVKIRVRSSRQYDNEHSSMFFQVSFSHKLKIY